MRIIRPPQRAHSTASSHELKSAVWPGVSASTGAAAVSLGLQYGVPLEVFVSKFAHMRFEPSGATNDPDIRAAKSIVDYVFRWMGKKFLTVDQQEEIGILSPEVRARLSAAYANGAPATPDLDHPTPGQTALFNTHEDAIECSRCGGRMVRAGTCYTCRDCGTSTGCG